MDSTKDFLKKLRLGVMAVLLIFSVFFLIYSEIPLFDLVMIMFATLIGIGMWIFVGLVTPNLHAVIRKLGFKSTGNCRITKNEPKSKKSFTQHAGLAIESSMFPTFTVLFFISYAMKINPPEEYELYYFGNNPYVWLLIFFAPVLSAFIIPVRIMMDSSVKNVDEEKNELISLGRIMYIKLLSIGGFAAFVVLLSVLYNAYEGNLGYVFEDIAVAFSYVYIIVFLTSLAYYKWHDGFVKRFEKQMGLLKLPNYEIHACVK